MNRANPKDLRQAIEAAHTYMKAGILFVAMPVMNETDCRLLQIQAAELLEHLAQAIEKESQS